LYHVGT